MKIIFILMVFSLSIYNIDYLDLDYSVKSNNQKKTIEKVYNVYNVDIDLLNKIYDLTMSVYGLHEVDYYFYLICSLIYVESRFNTNANSSKNAYGLCQIRLINQKDINSRYDLSLDRFNVSDNILLGLLNIRFWSEYYNSLEKSLIFYNVGNNYSDFEIGKDYYNKIMSQMSLFS